MQPGRTTYGYKKRVLFVVLEKSRVLSAAKELTQVVACGSRVTSSKASLANKKPLELGVNEVVLNKPPKELNRQFHESGMGSRQESRKWEDEYTSFLAPSGEHHVTSLPLLMEFKFLYLLSDLF